MLPVHPNSIVLYGKINCKMGFEQNLLILYISRGAARTLTHWYWAHTRSSPSTVNKYTLNTSSPPRNAKFAHKIHTKSDLAVLNCSFRLYCIAPDKQEFTNQNKCIEYSRNHLVIVTWTSLIKIVITSPKQYHHHHHHLMETKIVIKGQGIIIVHRRGKLLYHGGHHNGGCMYRNRQVLVVFLHLQQQQQQQKPKR